MCIGTCISHRGVKGLVSTEGVGVVYRIVFHMVRVYLRVEVRNRSRACRACRLRTRTSILGSCRYVGGRSFRGAGGAGSSGGAGDTRTRPVTGGGRAATTRRSCGAFPGASRGGRGRRRSRGGVGRARRWAGSPCPRPGSGRGTRGSGRTRGSVRTRGR